MPVATGFVRVSYHVTYVSFLSDMLKIPSTGMAIKYSVQSIGNFLFISLAQKEIVLYGLILPKALKTKKLPSRYDILLNSVQQLFNAFFHFRVLCG